MILTPVYKHLLANLFILRLKACYHILTTKRSMILQTISKQQSYGLAKYGKVIDENQNFDSKQYALEELADYLVYTSYTHIYKK